MAGGAGLGLAPPIGSAVSSLSHSRQQGNVRLKQSQVFIFIFLFVFFFLAVMFFFINV